MKQDGDEGSSVMENMFAALSLGAEITCYYGQT